MAEDSTRKVSNCTTFQQVLSAKSTEIINFLCIHERLFVFQLLNKAMKASVLLSDWKTVCIELMNKSDGLKRWIPGMRTCGSPWDPYQTIEYVPRLVTNQISLEDVVLATSKGTTNQHWHEFFENFIAPCPSCITIDPSIPLPLVDVDVLATQFEITDEDSRQAWDKHLANFLKFGECKRALKALEKPDCVWEIHSPSPEQPLPTIEVSFGQRAHSALRRTQNQAPAQTLSRERLQQVLMQGAPEYDVWVYAGALGGTSGCITLLNRHGLAKCRICLGINTPLFDPLAYHFFEELPIKVAPNKGGIESGETDNDSDTDVSSPPEDGVRQSNLVKYFPWMNIEDQCFVQQGNLYRRSCCAFLQFKEMDASIGTIYRISNPWRGTFILNYDEM